jgi:MSHA pilin protein MshD
MCGKSRCCRQAERGLTLIELLVFIVILGVATTAILGVFGSLTRSSANLLPEKQAQAFAASKLAEIMAEPFPTVITKYHGVNTMAFPDNTSVTSLQGYSVSIAAVAGTAASGIASVPVSPTPPVLPVPPAERLLVTVIVTTPNGSAARVQAIRIR